LGTFWVRDDYEIHNLYSRSFTPKKRLEILGQLAYFSGLKLQVREKLSRMSYHQVEKLIYLWRGIENAIVLSTPELINKPAPKAMWRIWKWSISTGVHSIAEAIAQWKSAVLHFQHAFAWSDDLAKNLYPRNFPLGFNGHWSTDWLEIAPWMACAQLCEFIPKSVAERIGILLQSRQEPAPDLTLRRAEAEADKLKEILTRPTITSGLNLDRLFRQAEMIGKVCRADSPIDRPHVSLNLRGSLELSRSEGGRLNAFLQRWLKMYVKSVPDHDAEARTWFGAPYCLKKGIPKFKTMCRQHALSDEVKDFLSSSFLSEDALGSQVSVQMWELGFGEMPKCLDEPMFGLDSELPLQLHQGAIEMAVEDAYLDITPQRTALVSSGTGRRKIPARGLFICEPGNKVRIVTKEPSYSTVLLQPLQHLLAGYLANLKTLEVAFTRSYKGYDFAKLLHSGVGEEHPDNGLGVFDLESASNNLDPTASRAVLYGFLRGLGFEDLDAYFTIVVEWLTRDRIIDFDEVIEHQQFRRTIMMTFGSLMGNPLTKEVLSLTLAATQGIVQSELALRSIPPTIIAGDDVASYCSRKFLDRWMELLVEVGTRINFDRALFSRRLAFFCEEVLVITGRKLFQGRNILDLDYETESCHADIIKLRLLSPFGKGNLDELHDTNPCVGKSAALSNALSWYPRKDVRTEAVRRFHREMAKFHPFQDPLVLLPTFLGGYSLPTELSDLEELLLLEDHLDPLLIRVFAAMARSDTLPTWVSRLITRMRTGGGFRGVIDPMEPKLIDQFAVSAVALAGQEVRSYGDFLIRDPERPALDDPAAVARRIRKENFLSPLDIAREVDRQTALKVGFLLADGQLCPDDVLPTKGWVNGPSEVLRKFANKELPLYLSSDELEWTKTHEFEDFLEFERWYLGGKKRLFFQKKIPFVPRSIIAPSCASMEVPLPYRAPEYVRGRSIDDDVEAKEGYSVEYISLRRLYSD
jgi:hypothetical protein